MNKLVQEWFRISRQDLMGAEYNLAGPDELIAFAGFLCQQAVEKAIKGFLVLHKKRFTKTHNIAKLLMILGEIDNTLATELKPTIKLTDLAVKYRYPEAGIETITRKYVEDSLQVAKEACQKILAKT